MAPSVSTNERPSYHQKQGLTTMQSVKSCIMLEQQGKLYLCMIHTIPDRINIYLFFLEQYFHSSEFQMITKQHNLTTKHLLSPHVICKKLHHVRTTRKNVFMYNTHKIQDRINLYLFFLSQFICHSN